MNLFNSKSKPNDTSEVTENNSSFDLDVNFNIKISEKVLMKVVPWLLALLGATGAVAEGAKHFQSFTTPYTTENKVEQITPYTIFSKPL